MIRQIIFYQILAYCYAQTPVQILSITTLLNYDNYNQGGSYQGGTTIYLKATGLDPTPSNNIVTIGTNPSVSCQISNKGVNGLQLACDTVANLNADLTNQQIYLTVTTSGQPAVTCTSCKFNFLSSRTPVLYQVAPRSVLPNMIVYWQAQYQIPTYNYINDMMFGLNRCSMFGPQFPDEHQNIQGNNVYCQVAQDQPAGYYKFSLNTQAGNAQLSSKLTSYSVLYKQSNGNPKVFHSISLALITSLNTNQISPMGQLITINGFGFTDEIDNVQVQIGPYLAYVFYSSPRFIQALVPAFPDDYNPTAKTNGFVGGGGLRWTKYDLSKSGIYNCLTLRQQILQHPSTMTIINDGIRPEPYTGNGEGYQYGEYYRGFFKATVTGNYKFYLNSDDCSAMWINLTPQGSSQPDNVTLLTQIQSYCAQELNYHYYNFNNKNQQISTQVSLVQDEYYYVEFIHTQGWGGGYFSVAVEIPNTNLRPDSVRSIQNLTLSYTPVNEQFSYDLYNDESDESLSGTYNLQFIYMDPTTRSVVFNKTTNTLQPNASADEVQITLQNQCQIYCTVKQIPINKLGQSQDEIKAADESQDETNTTADETTSTSTTNTTSNTSTADETTSNTSTADETTSTTSTADETTSTTSTADETTSTTSTADETTSTTSTADETTSTTSTADETTSTTSTADETTTTPSSGTRILQQSQFQVAGYRYIVTVTQLRSTNSLQRVLPKIISKHLVGPYTFFPILIKSPSPPISGTFKISYNGDEASIKGNTSLAYNIDETSLNAALNNISGFSNVQSWKTGNCQIGCSYFIRLGIPGAAKLLQTDIRGLLGGSDETTPQITVSQYQAGSNNIFSAPMSAELFYTAHSNPQVVVRVNNVYSSCQDSNCDSNLARNTTPTMLSYSFDEQTSTLSVTLSNPSDEAISENSLSLSFGGQECQSVITQSPTYTFSCILANPNIEAGDWVPYVHIEPIGFPKIDSAVQNTQQQLSITSVSPALGSVFGGTPITVIGTGFPINATRLNRFSITIGGVAVPDENFISVSPTQLVFSSPAQATADESTIVITTLNQTGFTASSTSFVYSKSVSLYVVGISPSSSSPIKKAPIKIWGKGFDDEVTVQLVQSNLTVGQTPKIYQLNVLSVVQDETYQDETGLSMINAFLGGGISGTYNVRVVSKTQGYSSYFKASTDDDFSYIVLVKSVTPNKGSGAGGTLITITGENFTPGSVQVFIGNAVNWLCKLVDESTTQITCLTPEKNNAYDYDSPVDILVTSNIIDESRTQCDQGSLCTFQYDDEMTPLQTLPSAAIYDKSPDSQTYVASSGTSRILQEQSTTKDMGHRLANPRRRNLITLLAQSFTLPNYYVPYSYDETVTIEGKNFGTSPTINIGEFGNVTTFISNTDEQIQFQFPNLPAGFYSLTVVNNPWGYATGSWNAFVALQVVSVSPDTGSAGGQLITITGQGFNTPSVVAQSSQRQLPTVTVGGLACLNVQVISSSQITCLTPMISSTKQNQIIVYQKNITSLLTDQTSSQITFTSQFSVTPQITYIKQSTFTTPAQIYIQASGSFIYTTTPQVILTTSTGELFTGVVVSNTLTLVNASFSNVAAGTYQFFIIYPNNSYSYLVKNQIVIQLPAISSPSAIMSSIIGGASLTLNGQGFSVISTNNLVSVCGFQCAVTQSTFTSLTCETPTLMTKSSQQLYQISPYASQINLSQTNMTQDQISLKASLLLIDNNFSSFYWSNINDCFVQYDFGALLRLKLKSLQYIPQVQTQSSKFYGGIFEYSKDNITFTNLFTINNNVHSGWNYFTLNDDELIADIRYLRYRDPNGASGSHCMLAEIQVFGWLLYFQDTNQGNALCNVTAQVNGQVSSNLLNNWVNYKSSLTPVVSSLSPTDGKSIGGFVLTITGTGFGTNVSAVNVLIENVTCQVQTVSDSTIECLVGNQNTAQYATTDNSFSVTINSQYAAITCNQFIYADPWSDPLAWGGDIPPRDGDVVIVPMGKVLMVDIPVSPKLYCVLVEGTMLFRDGIDIDFYVNYILVRMGTLTIGTENQPRKSKLTITLSGSLLDQQLPSFGNKFIGCHDCQLDIHGTVRNVTWTSLSQTADQGDEIIYLQKAVDWQVGEQIVIASTNWNHQQAETRIISSISYNPTTKTSSISFTPGLEYRHYSAVEIYGNQSFPMQAEVGLLSRNIVIQGNPDDSQNGYGAHLMVHGTSGAVGRISYAEFRYGGQQKIIGRYPIHFHLNGPMYDSYVIGNSIHHSNARMITVHGVNYLRLIDNVGYNCFGHAVFLEDGIEQYNVLQNNLIMGNKQIWILQQTDITSASYWITNPQNYLTNNHAAGSEWFGFWYQIKEHPDGASATSDVCPQGLTLGLFANNIAHSNAHFGLRILRLASAQTACGPTRNDKLINPWSLNPQIQSVFYNFTTFANDENGILAEQLGWVTFENFMVADSKKTAFQTHQTNFTDEGALINNWLIVGQSRGNSNPTPNYYRNAKAIMTPRTNGFAANNIRIHNFNSDMIILQSCSQCDHMEQITGSKNSKFSNFTFTNTTNVKYIFWQVHRREIFWDLDGSLSGIKGGAYIFPYKAYALGVPGCTYNQSTKWDNSTLCQMNKTFVRDILINNPQPESTFLMADMYIYRVQNGTNMSLASSNQFELVDQYKIESSADLKQSWADPFIAGYTYNIHWNSGMDFTNVGVQASQYFKASDPGVILRFNYSNTRELYDLTRIVAGAWTTNFTQQNTTYLMSKIEQLNVSTCRNGDQFHDQDNKFLYICFSGRNRTTPWEYININAVQCRFKCPVIAPIVNNISKVHITWSDESSWPKSSYPTASTDEVVILSNWIVTLDMVTPKLKNLIVDGQIIFQQQNTSRRALTTSSPIQLHAYQIWIRQGSITIGSAASPFTGQGAIILHGTKNSNSLIMDPFIVASNKVLAVTGQISIYAVKPACVWTRLISFANSGSNQIQVACTSGWNVGDNIVIGPSGRDPTQHEYLQISAINGNTITLNRQLLNSHYGAPDADITVKGTGTLDMRAAVGHLTRNFKVIGFNDSGQNWGGHFLVSQLEFTVNKTTQVLRGSAQLNGVEFINMGQPNSLQGGLDFQYLDSKTQRNVSLIQGCSFRNSSGMLLNSQFSNDVQVDNNVFYNGVWNLVQMTDGLNMSFTNNLLIGLIKQTKQNSAFGQFASAIAPFIMKIQGNVGQGSQDTGFALYASACSGPDETAYKTSNNTISSCLEAAYTFAQTNPTCALVIYPMAFHSARGVMSCMLTDEIRVQNIILAENDISLVMKTGVHNNYKNVHYGSNWYITALARPNCPQCYQSQLGTPCQGQVGLRMATITTIAFPPITVMVSSAADTICKIEQLDGRNYISNAIFVNFRQNYTDFGSDFAQCKSNFVMSPHPGSFDVTSGHYLSKSKCTNCTFDSLAKFLTPSTGQIGWFGGCGNMVCSGQHQVLIQDSDGQFLGKISSAISPNPYFGPSMVECSFQTSWNGYHCISDRISVLDFMSIAPDYNTRLYSPVILTNGKFNNTINAFHEWNWKGIEPQNTRESKFAALIELNSTINMTNAGQNPSDSQYWLQKRTQVQGNQSDWVIISYQFQTSQCIQVLIGTNNTIVSPLTGKGPFNLNNYVNTCGANLYFSKNNTIMFVVNGQQGCIVRIRQIDSIMISSHLEVGYDEFFSDSQMGIKFQTTFIAYLMSSGIDTSQVKILGYSKGSVIVETVIPVITNETQNVTQAQQQLVSVAQSLNQSMQSPTSNFSQLGYKLAVNKLVSPPVINLTGIPSTSKAYNGTYAQYIADIIAEEQVTDESVQDETTDETTHTSDETTPATDETTPTSDETTPTSDETTPTSDETTPTSDQTTPAPNSNPNAVTDEISQNLIPQKQTYNYSSLDQELPVTLTQNQSKMPGWAIILITLFIFILLGLIGKLIANKLASGVSNNQRKVLPDQADQLEGQNNIVQQL